MEMTIRASVPHDDPDASLAFYRDRQSGCRFPNFPLISRSS
jgi:hypothetical protein